MSASYRVADGEAFLFFVSNTSDLFSNSSKTAVEDVSFPTTNSSAHSTVHFRFFNATVGAFKNNPLGSYQGVCKLPVKIEGDCMSIAPNVSP